MGRSVFSVLCTLQLEPALHKKEPPPLSRKRQDRSQEGSRNWSRRGEMPSRVKKKRGVKQSQDVHVYILV